MPSCEASAIRLAYFALLWFPTLAWFPKLASAEDTPTQITRGFELKPRETKDAVRFEVYRPGPVHVEAIWDGAPEKLTLSLVRSDLREPIKSQTGASPLQLDFEFQESMITDVVAWKAQVGGEVNAPIKGTLEIRYVPGLPRPRTVSLRNGSLILPWRTIGEAQFHQIESEVPRQSAVVALSRKPTASDRALLAGRGLELKNHLGGEVFLAALSTKGLGEGVGDDLSSLVAGIGPLPPNQKIDERIDLGQFSRFQLPKRGNAEGEGTSYVLIDDGTKVNLTVVFLKGTSAAEMERALRAADVDALQSRTNDSYIVKTAPGKIAALKKIPSVVWIDAGPAPAVGENDKVRLSAKTDVVQGIQIDHRPPSFVLSGAGDRDLLIGDGQGHVVVSINEGSDKTPSYRAPVALSSGQAILSVGSRAAPTMGDRDGDGVADLLVGSADGSVKQFINIGTDARKEFGDGQMVMGGGNPLNVDSNAAPLLWDIDDDGDRDLVIGNGAGEVYVAINSKNDAAPSYDAPSNVKANGNAIDVGSDARPTAEDVDGDRLLDLVVGNAAGGVLVFLNEGGSPPSFAQGVAIKVGQNNLDVGDAAAPTFIVSALGNVQRLLVGNAKGEIHSFRRVGALQRSIVPTYQFEEILPIAATGVDGKFAVPLCLDLDLDGVRVVNAEATPANWAHQDFEGRVVARDDSTITDDPPGDDYDHSTHVMGTFAGSGARSKYNDAANRPNGGTAFGWRGMAPGAGIIFVSNIAGVSERFHKAINFHGANVINASIGWNRGDYGPDEQLGDQVIRGDASFGDERINATTTVYSAGNSGPRFFSLTKQFKNAILVGNWDVTHQPPQVRELSSRGPTADGRIKPDLVADGSDVKSTAGVNVNGYRKDSGTSMSSPAVAGAAALLLDSWSKQYGCPITAAVPSTVRALLIHSAENPPSSPHVIGPGRDSTGLSTPPSKGPDFVTGWGLLNVQAANQLVLDKAIIQDLIEQTGAEREYEFSVAADSTTEIKVTLTWDDPANEPPFNTSTGAQATDYLYAAKLINDLDLELETPSGMIVYPFVLNQTIHSVDDSRRVLSPEEQVPGTEISIETWVPYGAIDADMQVNLRRAPSGELPRGRDHLNNVEQATAHPEAGTWKARVRGFKVPNGPQQFSLIGPWGEDRVAPTIRGPATVRVTAPNDSGIPAALITPGLAQVTAFDARDPAPKLRLEAPRSLAIGQTSVAFVATDYSGNETPFPLVVSVSPHVAGITKADSQRTSQFLEQLARNRLARRSIVSAQLFENHDIAVGSLLHVQHVGRVQHDDVSPASSPKSYFLESARPGAPAGVTILAKPESEVAAGTASLDSRRRLPAGRDHWRLYRNTYPAVESAPPAGDSSVAVESERPSNPGRVVESEQAALHIVAFDENGLMLDGPAFDQLVAQTALPTDIFVMSHGWWNDAASAKTSYENMLALMSKMASARQLRPVDYRPFVIGTRWPSKAWVDDRDWPAVESETSQAGRAAVQGPGKSIDPRLVAAIYESFPRGKTSERAYSRDIMRMEELLTTSAPSSGDVAEAFQLFRTYSLSSEFPEDQDGFDSPRAGLAAAREPESEFSILDPFRAFTYWQMKARAGIVGENGVREMVKQLQRKYPTAKVHLFGHSFGAKVVLSVVGDRDRPLPRAVETVVLLQPAISLESFAEVVTGSSPPAAGGYRRALDLSRIKGPVVVTYSRDDVALNDLYPLASRLARQTGVTEQEGPTRYSAMGAFGAYGAVVNSFGPSQNVAMKRATAANNEYPFMRGVWSVNGSIPDDGSVPRDGTALIADHTLIYNDDVAWLLWQAILAGRR